MKKIKIILPVIFSIIILFFLFSFLFVYTQTRPVVNNKTGNIENALVRVEIPSGTSTYKIAGILKADGLIKNEKLFYYMARSSALLKIFTPSNLKSEISSNFVLKSGTYYVSPTMHVAEILELLSSGQTEYVKVSVPEGLTISKIASILEENRICPTEDFKKSTKNSALLAKYDIPSETCEGYLFPDTYFLTIDMKSDEVVSIMIQNFFEKIKSVKNLSDKTPEELNYIVKLASIVEREYKIDEEAPLIASVFRNRLRINMGLYSCATVEYIITEIQGKPHPERILTSDTRIDSPYNTYLHAGLPPTPISNPGLIALDASTNTPKTKNFYFQVVDADAGRHVFVETLEEHRNNH